MIITEQTIATKFHSHRVTHWVSLKSNIKPMAKNQEAGSPAIGLKTYKLERAEGQKRKSKMPSKGDQCKK